MANLFMKNYSKEEKSWILYDVANSAYTLTIVTVLFPILFANLRKESGLGQSETVAYTQFAVAMYSIIVALLAPILGTFADYKGMKKRMFLIFLTIGVVGGFLLSIPGLSWKAVMAIYIFATIGFSGANIFYDAFLTDVTTNERMDEVSSLGFGLGYIGSVVPFLAGMAFFAVARFTNLEIEENTAIYIAFFIASLWWALFSIPFIKNVHQVHCIPREDKPFRMTFRRLGVTFMNIRKYKKIFLFLVAYFFYIDGVHTIITAAVPIATALEIIDDILLLVIALVIQIVAFPCAIIYGKLARKFGSESMILLGIITYMIICLIAYRIETATDMLIIAILIGFAQGGIQSISRAYFGKLVPKEKSNEFFGFFSIFGKFAAILGPLVVGFISQQTGNPRAGMLGIVILLMFGAVFFIATTKVTQENV